MQIEFYIEEPSAEAALSNLVPRIFTSRVLCRFHPFRGKDDLLRKLPNRLKAHFYTWLQSDLRIVVLVDEDREDCIRLKNQLERAARNAGLPSKTTALQGQRFAVLNRLAIEELEAWFFGDIEALVSAYPRVPQTLARRAKFRDPDQIVGGTWEALEDVLQQAGYYPTGMPKVEVARRVSSFMSPARNRSKSFQVFRDGLLQL